VRVSRLLPLLGDKAPCLMCHAACAEALNVGCPGLAFLIPQLAQAVWNGAAEVLSANERALLNNELANLVRHLSDPAPARAILASRVREAAIGQSVSNEPHLAEMVAEFLAVFAEPRASDVAAGQRT
jgi:hypothetical protein